MLYKSHSPESEFDDFDTQIQIEEVNEEHEE